MSLRDLPTLNAALNGLSTLLLVAGYVAIRRGRRAVHQRCMLAACVTSTLFLASYLTYHFGVALVTRYPHHDWTRPLYLLVLATHVVLAALLGPFVLVVLWRASHERFEAHRRLARWVWPAWLYVSVTGVVIYAMLYLRPAPG